LAKKRKRKKNTSKDLLYPKTLSQTSPQNLHHTYLYRKLLFQVYYMCHAFAFKFILIFIVQFKAHGKSSKVYGDYHYVRHMFDKLLVAVKSNHAVMEQDFQHCTILVVVMFPWLHMPINMK
jgi:hypothetical protein